MQGLNQNIRTSINSLNNVIKADRAKVIQCLNSSIDGNSMYLLWAVKLTEFGGRVIRKKQIEAPVRLSSINWFRKGKNK